MTSRLARLVLHVSDPETLADFYCQYLGMSQSVIGGDTAVGYGAEGIGLVFKKADTAHTYRHDQTDRFWKIALTLPDLVCAHEMLCSKGIAAADPHQFRDIGFLSHFADPEGHVIELVQHTFEGEPKTRVGDSNLPLGGGAEIGLVTLRTTEIADELAYCESELGLRYLVREQVSDLGFDLYFLGHTEDRAPDANPDALINRPWIYQRPYTVLEFQHLKKGVQIIKPTPRQTGFAGLVIEAGEQPDRKLV